MGKKDPRVDAYIAKAGDFAKPILTRLRDAVHARVSGRGRGDEVELSALHVQGHALQHGVVQGARGLRVLEGLARPRRRVEERRGDGTARPPDRVSDLPSKPVLASYIKKAVALNDEGVKVARVAKRAAPKALRVPADLASALNKSKKAHAAFAAFSPSHKREYLEWITEAKSADTRARRLQTAIEWMAEGKSRNWKYVRALKQRPDGARSGPARCSVSRSNNRHCRVIVY